MNIGTCQVLTRFASDLYSTLPDELASQMSCPDINRVPIDDAYIQKRIYICADFCTRTLLPLVLNKRQVLKSAESLRSLPIVDPESLFDAHAALDKIAQRVDSALERGPKLHRPYFMWLEETVREIQWVVEAAIHGTAVVGPLTVNAIDRISEEVSWDVVFPHTVRVLKDLEHVQLLVN